MRTIWRLARLLQEKTRKILDIWTKNNTFPSSVLTRLAEVAKDPQQKGAYRNPAFVLLSTSFAMQSHRPLSYRGSEVRLRDMKLRFCGLLLCIRHVKRSFSRPTPSSTRVSSASAYCSSTAFGGYRPCTNTGTNPSFTRFRCSVRRRDKYFKWVSYESGFVVFQPVKAPT